MLNVFQNTDAFSRTGRFTWKPWEEKGGEEGRRLNGEARRWRKKRHAIMSHVLWKYSNQDAIMRKKRLRLDLLFLPFVPLLGDFKTAVAPI